MADKFLNETGIAVIRDWVKSLFTKKTDFDALSDKVDEVIAEGGEPNVIDSISVNGSTLTPDAQKNVNIEVPTSTSDLTNDGDGTSNFATEAYVDANGGKIDVIKVNGTAQTITNKEVNLTVPTKTSDLTNDSDYQSEAEVQALIDDALADITGVDFQVVQELPSTGEKGVIYLVPKTGTTGDIYDEYIYVTAEGGTARFEKIGTTEVDLSGYWSKTELQAMTIAEIQAILNANA